jgi:uncharacterized RDD family membrane protein YckC
MSRRKAHEIRKGGLLTLTVSHQSSDAQPTHEIVVASWAQRAVAALVDFTLFTAAALMFIIVSMLSLVGASVFFSAAPARRFLESTETELECLITALVVFGFIVISSLFLASKWRATPGMKLLKIQIVTTEAKTLTFRHAFWRQILFVLAGIIPIVSAFTWLTPLQHPRRLALYDVIAKTLAIRRPTAAPSLA